MTSQDMYIHDKSICVHPKPDIVELIDLQFDLDLFSRSTEN